MKLNLDKTYFFDGKQYGPGETEVPDAIAPLVKRGMANAKKKPEPEKKK